MSETVYKLGDSTVTHMDDYTVTSFPDGTRVVSEHGYNPEQQKTADDHQMTVEEMNRGHDLAHSLLADLLGLPASPTLKAVAGRPYTPYYEWWWVEERAVLALQAYAKVAGVDLGALAAKRSRDVATGERPKAGY